MKEEVVLAALAGLLHDVGKLEQRANVDPWRPAQGYEDIHPVHAGWTASFIQAYVPQLYQGALHGAYHHRPGQSQAENRRLGWLVALADKLSAGERADMEEDAEGKKVKDPPQQLRTIFSRLFNSEQKRYLPLKPLSLNRQTLFAEEATIDSANRVKAYEELRDALRKAAKQDAGNANAYLEHLLSAMQRYTWCVPSAYYHSEPDVSLYDHSRMTAALAVCLTEFDDATLQRYHQAIQHSFEKNETAEDRGTLNENVALLIGGDISGIQDFIYTISAQHAAKTLRGRSFYLQLLTEALLRAVLRDLDLPYTNVIYSGGGHFFLLAPISAQEKLPALRKRLTERLYAAHGPALYLALDAAEVPLGGFRLGHFPRYWDRMHAALARRKQHKYSELGDELYTTVFAPKAHGGNREHLCSVCGMESEQVKPLKNSDGEVIGRICPLCFSFDEQIGKRLPNARLVVLGLSPFGEQQSEQALDVLAGLGLHVRWPEDNKVPDLPAECEQGVVWAFDDPKDDRWPTLRLPMVGWLHYAVNQIPQTTFDELARLGEGIERLGVLRMDVDSLGTAFKTGFDTKNESIASLARLSALSFHISLFFDGWVKRICEEEGWVRIQRKGEDLSSVYSIYSVYAGGDDLFLIAPWHLVPGLAKRIAGDLTAYTGGQLHLSGGMAFIHGKYPVHQAAKDAQVALDDAKAHQGKNAFGFLGAVWGWDEFALLEQNYTMLKKMVQEGAAQDILQLVQTLGEMRPKSSKEKIVYGPWMWMAEYHLRRRQDEAEKHNPDLYSALGKLREALAQDHYAHLPRWSKAARWAQLFTRK